MSRDVVIAGFGTVGRAVARAISVSAPDKVRIVGVAKSTGCLFDASGLDVSDLLARHEAGTLQEAPVWCEWDVPHLLDEARASVLMDATPTDITTGEPGLTNILHGIGLGMDVVAATKGPFVAAFTRVMEAAREKGVEVRYEATVAGAVPVFSMARSCMRGDRVLSVDGILNGTSNYILSKMEETGASFDLILAKAQELGYAEADPTADVEGGDAAAKLVILANTFFGGRWSYEDVARVGISAVTPEALELARDEGFTIKLLASASPEGLEVRPQLVPRGSALAVPGVLNAVRFRMERAKELVLIGRGAGGDETAAAMLNDLLTLPERA
ncbi:MAG: homoserine dehydrogenase [Candidatus Undinarchaeales archaeon]|jgi:homoserine dehydrogenase|nr:homoserine dehydrogenase [Candidatus Undinarchaeales archaeon]MDP7492612.1 homoserine dehydrogenase [Candidatus Undinarchaeales archaeon]